METVFFDQSYFSSSGSYYWKLGEKQFSRKELILANGQLIFWLVKIFFLSILETPASDGGFFHLVETMFQESPSFQLLEKDFRANNVFCKKKEKL